MGKTILTFNEIIDLNQYLMEKGLNYKVHLHDRCGSQSFTIEALEGDKQERMETVKSNITDYFTQKDITPKFSENMLEFTII